MTGIGFGVGINRYRYGSGVGFVGLLDTYTGAAAAYSLRQLSSTYTGSAIRVRRASDNTEQDIGFASNELDVTALASFCSGTDGFVTTWYDQSSNSKDATQTTASAQPQIVSGGGVILENGKPCISFDGTNDFMNAISVGSNNSHTGVLVFKRTAGYIWSISYNDNNSIFFLDNNIRYWCRSTAAQINPPTSPFITTQNLTFFERNNLNMELFLNSVTRGTLTDTLSFGNASLNMQIGWAIPRNNASEYFGGTFQEIIYYPTYKGSDRNGIETNVNDFYSIY